MAMNAQELFEYLEALPEADRRSMTVKMEIRESLFERPKLTRSGYAAVPVVTVKSVRLLAGKPKGRPKAKPTLWMIFK